MRQTRRIFRPAAQHRRWPSPAVLLGAAALAWLLVGLGLPSDLFGSAPQEREWTVRADDVRVVDGDTLRLGDRTLRLSGIEAPARGLRCADAEGRGFDCGAASAEALARLVSGKDLLCRVHGRDRFGRALGACSAGTSDVNASLVDGGWARASAAAGSLASAAAAARADRRGLWAGRFPVAE